MTDFEYAGTELELFAAAHNWKSYWSRRILHLVTGDVLEVGAGIGANTPFLDAGGNGRWVCLEPDARLAARLKAKLAQNGRCPRHEVVVGTIQSLAANQRFDTILYIDVLEHIQNDREELMLAAARLRARGRVIVLSPAHQCLYTPFDATIGHFRRYNRALLRRISPPTLRVEQMVYLDSAGLLLSGANRLFLRQSMPTNAQLCFWDRRMIPVSRVLDKVLLHMVGKSILAVWRNS